MEARVYRLNCSEKTEPRIETYQETRDSLWVESFISGNSEDEEREAFREVRVGKKKVMIEHRSGANDNATVCVSETTEMGEDDTELCLYTLQG